MLSTLTNEQLFKTANAMKNGAFGSFAEHLGNAYLVADSHNKELIQTAFSDLFQKVYIQAIYAPLS